MVFITCVSDCIFEQEGQCRLEYACSFGNSESIGSEPKGCVHYVAKECKKVGADGMSSVTW